MTLLPGSVALKAINTTIVFPRTQEMQRTNVMPNAVWCSMQDHLKGTPMKVNEHKKHKVREKSSRKHSSELLALTIGDPDCTEYQHAEGDQLGFIEIIRQFPS